MDWKRPGDCCDGIAQAAQTLRWVCRREPRLGRLSEDDATVHKGRGVLNRLKLDGLLLDRGCEAVGHVGRDRFQHVEQLVRRLAWTARGKDIAILGEVCCPIVISVADVRCHRTENRKPLPVAFSFTSSRMGIFKPGNVKFRLRVGGLRTCLGRESDAPKCRHGQTWESSNRPISLTHERSFAVTNW
jgi:hypothetical protein